MSVTVYYLMTPSAFVLFSTASVTNAFPLTGQFHQSRILDFFRNRPTSSHLSVSSALLVTRVLHYSMIPVSHYQYTTRSGRRVQEVLTSSCWSMFSCIWCEFSLAFSAWFSVFDFAILANNDRSRQPIPPSTPKIRSGDSCISFQD